MLPKPEGNLDADILGYIASELHIRQGDGPQPETFRAVLAEFFDPDAANWLAINNALRHLGLGTSSLAERQDDIEPLAGTYLEGMMVGFVYCRQHLPVEWVPQEDGTMRAVYPPRDPGKTESGESP